MKEKKLFFFIFTSLIGIQSRKNDNGPLYKYDDDFLCDCGMRLAAASNTKQEKRSKKK